ncbi:MAG: alanine racemase [Bifidobacteriaceae bacterium]|nr:alanine racemase [Bifidobacteriaceae bacterium]MCI1978415.1 alanine racemase [Bifidobacteriaceae bacterium]
MTLTACGPWNFSSSVGETNYQKALSEYPAQAIVDLAALKANMQRLVSIVGASSSAGSADPDHAATAVMGVVKADAYGHGLLPSALAALAGGATWLGTAQPREALLLRKAGIGADRAHILTWLYNGTAAPFAEMIESDIDISVGSFAGIEAIAAAAASCGKCARVHVKVDTGFGRNGFTPEAFDAAVASLRLHESEGTLKVVAIWSHLAVADMPKEPDFVAATDQQVRVFEQFVARAERGGLHPEMRHLANTAATLMRPEIHYELTRPGIALYGYEPDPSMGVAGDFGLQPAMTLQAQLATVKDVEKGHGISYGRTYLTSGPTSTAVVPVGYADGIHRSASGANALGAGGKKAVHEGGPVRVMTSQGPRICHVSGRVCMDQFVMDLGGFARDLGVSEGDTVELFGPGRGAALAEPTADDWAASAQTISYEIFTCLRNRIPRLYLHAAETLGAADLEKLDPASLL